MAAASTGNVEDDYKKFLKFNPPTQLSLTGFREESYVWVFDESSKDFASGVILSEEGQNVTVKMGSGEERKLKTKECWKQNHPKFDGVEDCAELMNLNEASVFWNLKRRYEADVIYTYSGLFCVVINPYRRFPIYTPKMIDKYRGRRRNELAPHVYAIADGAYRNMIGQRENQSMLVTGESGAGKTENTKKVIQYLATIAGRTNAAGDEIGTLEQQILEANPILESFGNAKTLKNDNSSRFGKFIKVKFNAGGVICGADIDSYLLERSRVTWQAKGERCFHAFYQLLQGASLDDKKKLALAAPESFKFLSGSGCVNIAGVDDRKEYETTVEAMDIMGFSDTEQESIWRVVAAILHMSNLPFTAGPGESTVFKDKKPCAQVASLLKVSPQQLEDALLRPRVKAGTEIVTKNLNPAQAEYSRNALAKALYGRMFLWIVKTINKAISISNGNTYIGVLDIAGFEIFENNSFEQICINYTNERLQQFFNYHMFKLEQEEYQREKINWTFIDFGMDAQDTIDLIDKKPIGIFPLLEEECVFPKGTDLSFLAKLNGAHARNIRFKKPKFQQGTFRLAHYAGEVEYDVSLWLEKNRDPLQDDLVLCMKASKDSFISGLFDDEFGWSAKADLASAKAGGSGALGGSSAGKAATFATISKKYKEQLQDLMDTLYSTHPHFVRCIIPNHAKRPGVLEVPIVLDQLRCNGVLEGIRISRKGFPNRLPYAEFIRRYYLLHPKQQKEHSDPKQGTKETMDALKVPENVPPPEAAKDPYQYGTTKIFFRAGVLAWIEEEREKRIASYLRSIQAGCRGWLGRRLYSRLRNIGASNKKIQKNARCYLDFQKWQWWVVLNKVLPMIRITLKEKKLREQQEKAESLRQKIKEAEEQSERMKKDIAASQAAMDKAKQDLSDLQNSIAQQRDLSSQLESERDALTQRVDAIQRNLAGGDEQKEELEKDLATLKNQVVKEEADLSSEQRKGDALLADKKKNEEAIRRLEDNIEAQNASIAQLEAQKAALDRDVASLRDELADESATVSRLEHQRQGLQRAIEERLEEITSTKTENEKYVQAAQRLAMQNAEAKDELDSMIQQRDDLERQIKEHKQELDQAKLDSESQKNAGDVIAKLKAKLTKEIADAKDRLSETNEAIETLTKTVDKSKTELSRAQDAYQSALDDYNQAENRKRTTETNAETIKTKIEAARGNVHTLEKKKAALDQQLAGTKEDLNNEQLAKNKATQAARKTEGELEQTRANVDQVSRNRDDQLARAKKADSDFKTFRAEVDQERAALQRAARRKPECEAELERLRADQENSQALRQLDSDKRRLEAEITEQKDLVRDAENACASLDRKIRDLNKDAASLRSEKNDLDDSVAQSEGVRRQAERDAAAVRKQLEDLENEIAKIVPAALRAELASSKEELDKVELANLGLQRKIKQLEANIDEINKTIQNERLEYDQLHKELQEVQDEIRKKRVNFGEDARKGMDKAMRLKKLIRDIEDAHAEIELERTKKANLDAQRAQQTSALNDVEASLNDEKLDVVALQQQLTALSEEIARLRDEAEGAGRERKDRLRAEYAAEESAMERRINEEVAGKRKAEDTKRALQNELSDAQDRLEAEEESVARAQRTVKNMEKDLASLTESRDRIKSEAKAAQEALQKLKADWENEKSQAERGGSSSDQTECAELDDKARQLEAELAAAEKAYNSAKAQVSEKQTEIDETTTKVDQLRKDIDDAMLVTARYQAQVKELQEELDTLATTRNELMTEIMQKEGETKKARSELEMALDSKRRSDEQLESITQQVDKLKRQLEELNKTKFEKEREKKRADAELEETNNLVDSEARTRKRQEEQVKKMTANMKDVSRRLLEAEQLTSKAETNAYKMQEEYSAFKARLDALLMDREAADDSKKIADQELETSRDDLSVETRNRQRTEKALKEMEELQKELLSVLNDQRQSRGTGNVTLARERTAHERAKQEFDQASDRKRRLEDELEQMERERTALRAEFESTAAETLSLEKDRLLFDDEISQITLRIQEELKSRDRMETDARNFEKEIRAQKDALERLLRDGKMDSNQLQRLEMDRDRLAKDLEASEKARQDAEDSKSSIEGTAREAKADVKDSDDQLAKLRDQLESEKSNYNTLQNRLNQLMKSLQG